MPRFAAFVLFAVLCAAASAQVWKPMACPEPANSADRRHAVGAVIDPMTASPLEWKPLAGEQNCRATARVETLGGRTALRVDADFSGKAGLEYVDLNKPLRLPEGVQGLCYLSERSLPSIVPALRIADASGEVHQFYGQEDTSRGWHRIYYLLKGGQTWAGDGNGRLDGELTVAGLVFDRPNSGFKGKATVRLADLATCSLVDRPNAISVEVAGGRFGNVYAPGEKVRVRAYAKGEPMTWSLLDHTGKSLGSSRGRSERPVVEAPATRCGWFAVRFEVAGADGVRCGREFRYAVLPTSAAPGNPFLGLCTHYGQNAYPLETMDLMKRYGFTRFRDEISWGAMEPAKGSLALPDYAANYLEHARKVGLEPLIIFDYANKNYDGGGFPNSPEAIAGFAAYCGALAGATRDTVRDFEIWNEWIGGCGMGGQAGDHGPEAYGKLMKPAAEAARAARPDAAICGVGGEYGVDCGSVVARMFGAGATPAINAFSIHPYRYPSPPESSDLAGDMRRILDAAVAGGAPRHMWATEIGYPTHLGRAGVDEGSQAALCVRSAAILQTCGSVERLYWYDLKDDGAEPTYNEHNFGVIRHQDLNCAPKPAVAAFSVFARLTAGAKPVGLASGGAVWTARYRRGQDDLLLVWSPGGPAGLKVTGKAAALDMMGNRLAGVPTRASEEPIWLVGRNLKVAAK